MGSPLGLLSHADSHSLGDVGACVGYGGSRAESRCVVILSSRRILELPFRVCDRETPRPRRRTADGDARCPEPEVVRLQKNVHTRPDV